MDNIPIKFELEGEKYEGYFQPAMGAGNSSIFYLMIDKFYYGRLRYTDHWIFDPTPKTGSFVELTEYFGNYIVAWYG